MRVSIDRLDGTARGLEQALGESSRATARLEATGGAAGHLAESVTAAAARFEGLDRELAAVLNELQSGLSAFTRQVAEVTASTDRNLGRAATELGNVVSNLTGAIEELSAACRRPTAADQAVGRSEEADMAAEVHEGGDEGYFAAASDLMVGVLFVFLLLLTVFALNLRDEQDVIRATFERLRVELEVQKRAAEENKAQAQLDQERAAEARREAELQKTAAIRERAAAEAQRLRNAELLAALKQALAQLENESRGREQARTQLLEQLKSSLEARGVQVITIPEAGILRLPEEVLFGKGERTLVREAGPRLKVLAEALGGTLPCFA